MHWTHRRLACAVIATAAAGLAACGGREELTSAPHLAIVPGVMLVLTVLALNVFGDGVREALDPRAKVRWER